MQANVTHLCDVSIVGAGWAGIYTAFRLATAVHDHPWPAAVCLLEAYSRPGGRTYSTRAVDERYVIEAGAYRFAGDMHLPADLIRSLGLLSECYDPECIDDLKAEVPWPYKLPLQKITDSAGRHLGYGAALEAMLARFKGAGGALVLDARLASVASGEGCAGAGPCWRLGFADGRVALSAGVVLNMPRPALAAVAGLPAALGARWPALQCTARDFPPSIKEGATTTKVYAVYEDAWWVSALGLVRGTREDMNETATAPPVSIHYHDGEVLCAGAADVGGNVAWEPARRAASRARCRGVLQVFYRHSQVCPATHPTCMEWWAAQPRAHASEPLTVVRRAGASRDEEQLLATVHAKLLSMHAAQLVQTGAGPLCRQRPHLARPWTI